MRFNDRLIAHELGHCIALTEIFALGGHGDDHHVLTLRPIEGFLRMGTRWFDDGKPGFQPAFTPALAATVSVAGPIGAAAYTGESPEPEFTSHREIIAVAALEVSASISDLQGACRAQPVADLVERVWDRFTALGSRRAAVQAIADRLTEMDGFAEFFPRDLRDFLAGQRDDLPLYSRIETAFSPAHHVRAVIDNIGSVYDADWVAGYQAAWDRAVEEATVEREAMAA